MATWVLVDDWIERPNVDTFLDSSSESIVLRINDFKVGFSEVVGRNASVLHDGRFALAWAAESGGKMLIDAQFESSACLANVVAAARVAVGAGAAPNIDDARFFFRG